MIVVHHLNNSRSQRIVWLLEELAVPYRIEQHRRDARTNLAPPALKAVHPLGKAPVIEDDGLVVAESGAIAEYLVERYGKGRLMPQRGTPEHVRYLQWMHFAEGTLMLHLVSRMYVSRVTDKHPVQARVDALVDDEIDFVERELARSDYLSGPQFTAADVQMLFPLEFAAFYDLIADRHPRTRDYVARMQARPAYRRAIDKGGAYAFEPQSAASAAPFPRPTR